MAVVIPCSRMTSMASQALVNQEGKVFSLFGREGFQDIGFRWNSFRRTADSQAYPNKFAGLNMAYYGQEAFMSGGSTLIRYLHSGPGKIKIVMDDDQVGR